MLDSGKFRCGGRSGILSRRSSLGLRGCCGDGFHFASVIVFHVRRFCLNFGAALRAGAFLAVDFARLGAGFDLAFGCAFFLTLVFDAARFLAETFTLLADFEAGAAEVVGSFSVEGAGFGATSSDLFRCSAAGLDTVEPLLNKPLTISFASSVARVFFSFASATRGSATPFLAFRRLASLP